MSENECPSYLDWLEDMKRNPFRKPEPKDIEDED